MNLNSHPIRFCISSKKLETPCHLGPVEPTSSESSSEENMSLDIALAVCILFNLFMASSSSSSRPKNWSLEIPYLIQNEN